MSLTHNQSRITILDSKYQIYRSMILFFTVLFLILQSGQKARSAPVEQLESTTNTTESNSNLNFGNKGEERWYIQGAFATTLDNEESSPRRLGGVGAGISKFFINGHSVNLELNSLYFNQPSDDALGLNLALLLRWHFVRQPNWSFYIDGGAGILGTTNDVPSKGASFNFTPQVGGGLTIALKERRRLMLGLRWHHISHADLFGNNPGRDSILGYVGLNFSR